ncbi:hypothetical protein [Mycolicibacterium fortuitum]|uniref:hypothetical protein n=1 Tax=Paenibacillus sp. FSL W8-1287 TaxID=2954653 RepID=UPI001CE049A1|nr:hypothetical protein [Mycolicibacterium fortuitum]
MKFYLVKNVSEYGTYDYRGLDLSQFKPGTQIYNDQANEFAVISTEQFSGHEDVTEMTEAEYLEYQRVNVPKPITPVDAEALEQRLETTEADLGNLLLQSATDKATIAALEDTVGSLLLEVAALKGGVS